MKDIMNYLSRPLALDPLTRRGMKRMRSQSPNLRHRIRSAERQSAQTGRSLNAESLSVCTEEMQDSSRDRGIRHFDFGNRPRFRSVDLIGTKTRRCLKDDEANEGQTTVKRANSSSNIRESARDIFTTKHDKKDCIEVGHISHNKTRNNSENCNEERATYLDNGTVFVVASASSASEENGSPRQMSCEKYREKMINKVLKHDESAHTEGTNGEFRVLDHLNKTSNKSSSNTENQQHRSWDINTTSGVAAPRYTVILLIIFCGLLTPTDAFLDTTTTFTSFIRFELGEDISSTLVCVLLVFFGQKLCGKIWDWLFAKKTPIVDQQDTVIVSKRTLLALLENNTRLVGFVLEHHFTEEIQAVKKRRGILHKLDTAVKP